MKISKFLTIFLVIMKPDCLWNGQNSKKIARCTFRFRVFTCRETTPLGLPEKVVVLRDGLVGGLHHLAHFFSPHTTPKSPQPQQMRV